MTNRILIADDEADALELIAHNLSNAGFQVVQSEDGPSTLQAARQQSPALIVLDLMMSGMTGLEVCEALKSDRDTARIPIVLLTAKRSEPDRILAFELGADDFLTKPFSPRELVLRIQAILRRGPRAASAGERLETGTIVMELERHEVSVEGRQVDLTAIEFKLLRMLMERQGRLQSRDVLLNTIWGLDRDIESRTLDTHMRRLREKLGPGGEKIRTIRGFGYRIDER